MANVAHDVFMPMAEGSGLIVLIPGGGPKMDAGAGARGTRPPGIIRRKSPCRCRRYSCRTRGYGELVLKALAEAGIGGQPAGSRHSCQFDAGRLSPLACAISRPLRAGPRPESPSASLRQASRACRWRGPYPTRRVRLDFGRIKAIAGEKRTAQISTCSCNWLLRWERR